MNEQPPSEIIESEWTER